MLHYGSTALSSGSGQTLGTKAPSRARMRALLPGLLLAGALAGCAHPPTPLVFAPPPPPPVGHTYQVTVDVPPPTSRHIRITPLQQQEYQKAFNVIALKSALMVAALSCSQQDQYDKFMTAFQPHVLAEQHVMDAYFKRTGGAYGQTREDTFITLLANNQSVSGIAQGAMFCLNNTAEYKAVLALRSDTDLDSFVYHPAPDSPALADDVSDAPVVSHSHRHWHSNLAESHGVRHHHVTSEAVNGHPVTVADSVGSRSGAQAVQ